MTSNYHSTITWLNMLNQNEIDLYPIQFANLFRLRNNDAIYIFDEVGSGKTISSGIVAMDYLFTHHSGNVLVITTNSLARFCPEYEAGQFMKDWMDKLPIRALELDNRILVVNNHHSKFRERKKYGLIIVDEAHLFLNKDTLRYENLTEYMRASKIVFLTATPIKTSVDDLHTYVDIAESVLDKKLDRSWISKINTKNKDGKDVISSEFDVQQPVTRYFKDTIMALNIDGFENKAKRIEPCLWDYEDSADKDEVLFLKIEERLYEKTGSRFVLFTRFVENEAIRLGEFFKTKGFVHFCGESGNEKSYYVVTGRNGNELPRFSGTQGLPTVLILTYQISEQGLNLPGFNHVINYHIPAYPSALEQRFGRIDRMGKHGSTFDEIFICYLIKRSGFDSNTSNFYQAVAIYIYSMLSYLPSKNTLLSPNVIKRFIQVKVLVEEYTERILQLCKNESELENVISYYRKIRDAEIYARSDGAIISEKYVDMPEADPENDNALLSFCIGKDIVCDLDTIDNEEIKKDLVEEIRRECREMRAMFNKVGTHYEDEDLQLIIEEMRNKIMYCKFDWTQLQETDIIDYRNGVNCIDAIDDCGGWIKDNANYIAYVDGFNNSIKIPVLFNKNRQRLNEFYENSFINNDFNRIFPDSGHKELLEKSNFQFVAVDNENDRRLLLENIDLLIVTLPFFEMTQKFKKYLLDAATTNEGYLRVKFDFDPLSVALGRLSQSQLSVSKNFYDRYFSGYKSGSGYSTFFSQYFYIEREGDVIIASNWLKLSYHFLKLTRNNQDNLFQYFVYRSSGTHRTWTEWANSYGENGFLRRHNSHKVYTNDYWTKGIQSDLHGFQYNS